jgi:hypothetical protein
MAFLFYLWSVQMKITDIIVGKQYKIKINAQEITDKLDISFWGAVPSKVQGSTIKVQTKSSSKIRADDGWWYKPEALEELVAEAPGPLLEDNPQHIIDRQTFVSMLRHKGIKLRNA